MMGLGSRQVQQHLLHPDHAHLLRRADEDLLDLVLLGAIIALGLGTLIWFLTEPAPPMIFGSYTYRGIYLLFFNSVFVQFLFFLLCHWILDSARLWPRYVIFIAGVFCGFLLGVNGVFQTDIASHRIAFVLSAMYSFLVAGFAAYQAATLVRHTSARVTTKSE